MEDFVVGGQDRKLSDQEQFEQIDWYFQAHYPVKDLEDWLARLPDRLTHAAMMQLGSAADHEMPGVLYSAGITMSEHELGTVFTPSQPNTRTAVASWGRPAGPATENYWFPLVAAAAQLSGTTILATNQVAAAKSFSDTAWGLSEGCPAVEDAGFDNYLLTRPNGDWIQTPAAARAEIQAVAEFLRGN
ncbi:hypothetical protein WG915_04365 [Corynebacterium sp. H128]|uniref:hypothetical protein n=1 Tax=unclassified Corynebacterium TaxID=2624378 RepID=UPI0030B259F9